MEKAGALLVGEKVKKRQSMLERWELPLGIASWLFISLALTKFDYLSFAVAIALVVLIFKLPYTHHLFRAWVYASLIVIAFRVTTFFYKSSVPRPPNIH